MTRIVVSLLAILAVFWAFSGAKAAPATQPALLNADSSTDQVLDALDAVGRNLHDFSAVVRDDSSDIASGDDTVTTGPILYQRLADGDCRICITYDHKTINANKTFSIHHEYIVAQGKVIERDYTLKKQITQSLGAPGQKIDPFKLGQGPIPLPIGQKKEDVKNLFEVQKIPLQKGDPDNTIHLQLTPKAGTPMAGKFQIIDIFVDMITAMPARISTIDANQTTSRTIDLSDLKLNIGLGDQDFTYPPLPPGEKWDDIVNP